jgi:hypothetical protein
VEEAGGGQKGSASAAAKEIHNKMAAWACELNIAPPSPSHARDLKRRLAGFKRSVLSSCFRLLCRYPVVDGRLSSLIRPSPGVLLADRGCFSGRLIGFKFFWLLWMAEFLGIYFLADIWPKFRGVEKGHQHTRF